MTQAYFDAFVNQIGERAKRESVNGLSPEQIKALSDDYVPKINLTR